MSEEQAYTTDVEKKADGGVVSRSADRSARQPRVGHEQPAIERHELPGTIPVGHYHEYYHGGRWDATETPLSETGRLDRLATDEQLVYDVDIREPGPYDLTLRVAAADNAGGGHVGIVVDDEPLRRVAFDATGGWHSWEDVQTVVELPAGLHTVRLVVFDGGSRLKQLTFR